MKSDFDFEFLEKLKHSWSANVLLKNGKEITIWYTAYPMTKNSIDRIVSVASDYPKNNIKWLTL